MRTFIPVLGQGRQQLPPSRREERKCTEERDVTKWEDSLRSGFGGIYRISYGYRDVLDDLSLPAMPPLLLPRFEEDKDFKQALFVNIGEKI